jgi:hypothetical protein
MATLLLTVIALIGCGGGSSSVKSAGGSSSSGGSGSSSGSGSGGSAGSGSGGAGGAISATQKSVVEDGIRTVITSQKGQLLATITQAVANYLKTRSEIAASGVDSTGCVWAQYTDGVGLLFIGNRSAVPSGKAVRSARPTTTGARPSATSRRAVTRTSSVPTTANAVILEGFDPGLNSGSDQAVSDITSYASKKGYTNQANGATVSALRSLPVAGIFYFNTHGGGAGTAQDPFSLWTTSDCGVADVNDLDHDNAYDLSHGYLVHAIAEDGSYDLSGDPNFPTHYCVTAGFVKQYWAFNNQALVYLDVCFSNSGAAGALQAALRAKGAAMVAGWSANMIPDVGFPTASFMFDRMLGTNMDGDYQVTPAQRPFDFNAALQDAQQNNLAHYGGGVINGNLFHSSDLGAVGGPALLAPSISYMTVQERGLDNPATGNQTLTINGEFGTVQGTVQAGGTNLSVTSWSDTQIVCTLPNADQAGGSGPVTVITKANVKSNVVPLTVWNGTVEFTITDLPAPYQRTWTVTENIYFRADVHAYRTTSGGTPNPQKSIYFRAAAPSTCNWSIAQTLAPMENASNTSGTLDYGFHTSPAPLGEGWIFEGAITPSSKSINIGWVVYGIYEKVSFPYTQAYTVALPTDTAIWAQAASVGSDGFQNYTHPIATGFTSNWNLLLDDVTGNLTATMDDHLTIHTFGETHAPNPDNGEDDNS